MVLQKVPPFHLANWHSATLFANLYQNKYTGTINGYPFNAKQLTLSLNVNNQFSFTNGWSAELSGNYTSRNRNEGQAIILPAGQVSAGIAKQLLNNKASIKFNIRDIFYKVMRLFTLLLGLSRCIVINEAGMFQEAYEYSSFF